MLLFIVDCFIEIDVEIWWEDIMREEDSSKVFMFYMNFDDDDIFGGYDGDEGYFVVDFFGFGCEVK